MADITFNYESRKTKVFTYLLQITRILICSFLFCLFVPRVVLPAQRIKICAGQAGSEWGTPKYLSILPILKRMEYVVTSCIMSPQM